jgi:hypothetical protein
VRRSDPAGEPADNSWSVALSGPTGEVVADAAAECGSGEARLDVAGLLGLAPDDPVTGTSTYDLLWLPTAGDGQPVPVLGRVPAGHGADGAPLVRVEGGAAGLRVVVGRLGG